MSMIGKLYNMYLYHFKYATTVILIRPGASKVIRHLYLQNTSYTGLNGLEDRLSYSYERRKDRHIG